MLTAFISGTREGEAVNGYVSKKNECVSLLPVWKALETKSLSVLV